MSTFFSHQFQNNQNYQTPTISPGFPNPNNKDNQVQSPSFMEYPNPITDSPDLQELDYLGLEQIQIYTSFEDLPSYPPNTDMAAVISEIQLKLSDSDWKNTFTALDNLRILNKYYPSEITQLFAMFGSNIIESVNSVKTKILRNGLIFLKEVFRNAAYTPLHSDIITKFVPIVLSKTVSEKSFVREEAKLILLEFQKNCLQSASFNVVCACVFDKNFLIGEASLKLIARMLESAGQNMMSLEPGSWKILLETLGKQLIGKRANMSSWSISIFEFIHKILGEDNFFALLSNLLSPAERDFLIKEIRSKVDNDPRKKREQTKKAIRSDKRESMKRKNLGFENQNDHYGYQNGSNQNIGGSFF